jgi:ribosomal protein L9
MKIHLLEDVKHRGRRGDIVDVPDEVAIDLEKHGRAAFLPSEPEAAVDQGEAEGSGDDPQADEHSDEPETAVDQGEAEVSGDARAEEHSHRPKAKAKKAK